MSGQRGEGEAIVIRTEMRSHMDQEADGKQGVKTRG